jgi:uncharacterized repeat protein (TIGR04076 family)
MMEKHLGYTDEEVKLFRENPRNADVLSKTPDLMNKTIAIEVIESTGCNSQHKVGDKFYFDGTGNLITKMNSKRACCFALQSMGGLIFGAHELFYAGVDPNKMRFKRTGCVFRSN